MTGQWGPGPSLHPVYSGEISSSISGLTLKWQTWGLGCSGKLEPAFRTPSFNLSLAKRQVTGRGMSFPTSPGWQPQDLGHQCSNPTRAFRKHVFPWDFLYARMPLGESPCWHHFITPPLAFHEITELQ